VSLLASLRFSGASGPGLKLVIPVIPAQMLTEWTGADRVRKCREQAAKAIDASAERCILAGGGCLECGALICGQWTADQARDVVREPDCGIVGSGMIAG
jgi:hypothetical protein